MTYIDMSNEVTLASDIAVAVDGCAPYVHYAEGRGGGYVFDASCSVGRLVASVLSINLISLPGCNVSYEYCDTTSSRYGTNFDWVVDWYTVEVCAWVVMTVGENASYDSGATLAILLDV